MKTIALRGGLDNLWEMLKLLISYVTNWKKLASRKHLKIGRKIVMSEMAH